MVHGDEPADDRRVDLDLGCRFPVWLLGLRRRGAGSWICGLIGACRRQQRGRNQERRDFFSWPLDGARLLESSLHRSPFVRTATWIGSGGVVGRELVALGPDGLGRLGELGALVLGELELDYLLDASRPQPGRYAEIDIFDPVLARGPGTGR